MSLATSSVAVDCSGWRCLSSSRYCERRTTSCPDAVTGIVCRTPTVRSATSSRPWRRITSRSNVGGCSAVATPGSGRCTSRTLVCVKTAVKIRKNASITMTSSIGTMVRPSGPRCRTWLRLSQRQRQMYLEDAGVCEGGGEDREEREYHHDVEHRHDGEILGPAVPYVVA